MAERDALLDHINERFDSIDGRLEELGRSFDTLQSAVDGYAKRADGYFQEMLMLSRRVKRHERWLQAIAKQVGLQLDDHE